MAVTTAAVIGAGAAVAGTVNARKSAKEGVKAQEGQNARNEAFIQEQAGKAREDILPLFGAAQESRRLGAQGALDIFGQTIPQQTQLFQQGNVAAQEALLSGFPQVQNALLGRPVDLSGLQPQQFAVDTGFAQQAAPQFALPVLGAEREMATNTAAIRNVLGGLNTDFDVIQAAALGSIPGISADDQAFFQQHIINNPDSPRGLSGTGFLTANVEDISGVAGRSGFLQQDKPRVANLISLITEARSGA